MRREQASRLIAPWRPVLKAASSNQTEMTRSDRVAHGDRQHPREVALEHGLGRPDFRVDSRLLRHVLLDNGYRELPVTGKHAVATESLPPIRKDPFDRILVAQAPTEGVTLLTADARVARYPAPVWAV